MPKQSQMAVDRFNDTIQRLSDAYVDALRDLRNRGDMEAHDLLVKKLDAPLTDMADAGIDVAADYRAVLVQALEAVQMSKDVQAEQKLAIPRAFHDGRMTERADSLKVIQRLQSALDKAIARIREWEAWSRGESA